VREGERLVGRAAKQLVGALLLSVGPETGGLELYFVKSVFRV
jgi:hypothetical protein